MLRSVSTVRTLTLRHNNAIRITSLCMTVSTQMQTMQEPTCIPVDLLKLAKQLADLPATAAPSVVLEGSSLKRRQIMRYPLFMSSSSCCSALNSFQLSQTACSLPQLNGCLPCLQDPFISGQVGTSHESS